MDRLFEKSYGKLDRVPLKFRRYLLSGIDFKGRLIGIKGARGAGKTTLLLQYAKASLPQDHRTLYVSLDDLWFTENKLIHLAEDFVKKGGRYLLLDEVHRYPGWSQELKNIYDDLPDLQVVFTGSSIIHLNKARGDLSRRAVMYELFGLSFREYLAFKEVLLHDPVDFETIIQDHVSVSRKIAKLIRPIEHFSRYLRYGYYPYFIESEKLYPSKLEETISLALTADLPALHDISTASIDKIRLLLHIIAESVPFKPNISKLSERTNVSRNTLVNFLHYLDDLRIIKTVYSSSSGISALQKPEKVYLHHPNLQYALSFSHADMGSVRESFFLNQLSSVKKVTYPGQNDFVVDKYLFEIGGKDKTLGQVSNSKKSFIAMDGIEIGHEHKIPLWLFGFLY